MKILLLLHAGQDIKEKKRGISIQTNHIYNLIMQHNNKKVNLLGFRIYVTLV
jgi:hypothetical protein